MRARVMPAWAAAALLALLSGGCGYELAGEKIGLPDDVRTLRVGKIENRSREHGLEKLLAFAFEREIQTRRHFRVVEEGGADAVLSGIIRDVRILPVAFDANDQAVQYEVSVLLSLALTRQSDGHVLWQVSGLREFQEFSATSRVMLTSSSEFQRGTLDAKDVNNPEFNHIQLAETERGVAFGRLLDQAARDAYNQMVEDF